MKGDQLNQYFTGVAYKRLSRVEADPETSNQHEFNGTAAVRSLLQTDDRKFPARLVYFADDLEEPLAAPGELTWYDSRRNQPHRSAEYRLYFKQSPVSDRMAEGDLLVIARRPDDTLLVVVAQAGSTAENQIVLLFGLSGELGSTFGLKELGADQRLDLARAQILEQIGVEVDRADEGFLERIARRFPSGFPPTREFSAFARSTLPDVSATADPDAALVAWWDREDLLFKTFERHFVMERLRTGFGEDVDAFIDYSLSVHNTRKSRAGHALENHLEQVWTDCGIRYSRGKETENKAKPDFLFPGIEDYRNVDFPAVQLTMLGVKSTCKDRWRQVLSEARRIEDKHLFTLEAGITTNQTDEMRANRLQLVLPQALHASYTPAQQSWLVNLQQFIGVVRGRQ